MKNFMTGVSIITLLLFANARIYACEPCPRILNFKETVQRADLIVVGQKIAHGPSVDLSHFPDAPDWIDVEILKVLKGQSETKRIRVNSWDGMCPHGITIDNKKYIIFLNKRNVDYEDYQYDSVNYGCSVKMYSIQNNIIEFDERNITLEEFTQELETIINEN